MSDLLWAGKCKRWVGGWEGGLVAVFGGEHGARPGLFKVKSDSANQSLSVKGGAKMHNQCGVGDWF